MKRIIIGDIHGRASWKIPFVNEEWDEFIFIGDYFDTHEDILPIEQIRNFEDLIEFKNKSTKPVILLIGNHDYHYFPEIGYNGTSGYQAGVSKSIEYILNESRDMTQMAYQFDNILCTHAGVSKTFLEICGWDKNQPIVDFINDLWKYKPRSFTFNGTDPYGDNICQTPIWIRPKSLMRNSKELGFIQIVGHTTQNQIDIKGKSTGGKYYFIDTLGTSREYLIYEDGNFSTKTV